VFVAGGKLLDSVTPAAPAISAGPYAAPLRRRTPTGRSRPTLRHYHPSAESRSSHRRD
jgi:hypothetical protein